MRQGNAISASSASRKAGSVAQRPLGSGRQSVEGVRHMNGRAFKLGTFAKSDGKPFAAIVINDTAVPLADAAKAAGKPALAGTASLQDLLGDWDRNFATLQEIAAFLDKEHVKPGAANVTTLTALPPIAHPGKMFYAAQNFQEHVDEMIRAGMSPKDGP